MYRSARTNISEQFLQGLGTSGVLSSDLSESAFRPSRRHDPATPNHSCHTRQSATCQSSPAKLHQPPNSKMKVTASFALIAALGLTEASEFKVGSPLSLSRRCWARQTSLDKRTCVLSSLSKCLFLTQQHRYIVDRMWACFPGCRQSFLRCEAPCHPRSHTQIVCSERLYPSSCLVCVRFSTSAPCSRQVRVRNLTYLQPMSPPLVVAHTTVSSTAAAVYVGSSGSDVQISV